MIEAKGTRTTATQADASQRYVLKNTDRKSKTPLIFGIFLMGLAVYLKSIFPSWGSRQDPLPDESEKEGAAQPAMAQVQKLLPFDSVPVDTAPSSQTNPGTGGRLIELQPPARFIRVDTPEIGDFVPPEVPMAWKIAPAQLPARSAKDDGDGGGARPPEKPDNVDPDPSGPGGGDPDGIDPGEPGPGDGDDDACSRACDDDADTDPCGTDSDIEDEEPPACGGSGSDSCGAEEEPDPADTDGICSQDPCGSTCPVTQPPDDDLCDADPEPDACDVTASPIPDDESTAAQPVPCQIEENPVEGEEETGSCSGGTDIEETDDCFACAGPVVFVGGQNIFDFDAVQEAGVKDRIHDLEVGDRVRVSSHDLFEKSCDASEDRFGKIYGDDIDDDDAPIRYHHDRTDEMSRTTVEAGSSNDGIHEITIRLDGHDVLTFVEHM